MSKRLNNIKNENLFLIRFEDFIYNNDKMINILCDFLSIPKNTYSNFKPEESKLNIGKYNEFLTKKEIKIIENNLTSDLFNK
ncbi:hypothetical protein ACIJYF_00770 [Candidatus Pelagibacter bacterium nBUS_49]|uniref:hypothetical protein n=1 Tax=Candidatus Pelagibacter bacterium nBUS_49 TaxID=3374196 RepID=UPI003EC05D93